MVGRVWRSVKGPCLTLRRLYSAEAAQKGAWSTLDHLTHLSDQLYIENPTKYHHLRPPQTFLDLTVGHFCIRPQLKTIVENISRWTALSLSDVQNSDMLQLIISRLDRHCCTLDDPDQKLSHGFCRLIRFFKATNCNFVGQSFQSVPADSKEQIVSKLLLAAFCHNSPKAPISVDQDLIRLLAVQIKIMFNSMTPSELAVCFAGLQVISPCQEVSQLGDKITARYGFRLFQ